MDRGVACPLPRAIRTPRLDKEQGFKGLSWSKPVRTGRSQRRARPPVQGQVGARMDSDARLVLVVASSREDRRVLFDALDGMHVGEILSARNLIQARALLDQSLRPALAILDFEHAPTASRVLCTELADVPVIGLFGVRLEALRERGRLAGCANIKAWLRMPVDAVEMAARVGEALNGSTPSVDPTAAFAAAPPPEDRMRTTLRALADLLQPARGPAGLSGMLQQAMHVLGMDLMVIAERGKSGAALEPLARVDRLAVFDAPDLLAEPFAQRALGGDTVICSAESASSDAQAYLHATGHVLCAALPLFDAHRDVLGVMACASRSADAPAMSVLQPMLEIVAAHFAARLELRAEHGRGRDRALLDGLTGLPNRLLFNDRLESTLHDARRTGEVFAVLFVDLDRFKSINDSLGHAVGDQVLLAVADRLRGTVRASDTIARYAGDEFTLILRHVDSRADVARVASKLLAGMQAPLTLANGSELHVTASIGASVYPDDATDADGLVKHADMAMYSAKGEGRNNVKTFGHVPEDTHRQHLEMESRLRDAEANGELSVHYQPQIDIASGDVVAVEALVRWQHPVLGMLSPAFFIPLAEETGLIISIGEWVLRQACTDVAAWRRTTGRPLRLAVNLSALQWMQPNLAAMIQAACRDAGLEPGVLDLETPEGVLANPTDELAAAAEALHRIGCRIVIDDAGVARAEFDYAAGLTVDAIKIDHSFIRNIGSDADDETVVTAILAAARHRHMRTIAEGVETARQLDFLRERGCEAAQGYLFCRPLPAATLARRLVKPGAVSMRGSDA